MSIGWSLDDEILCLSLFCVESTVLRSLDVEAFALFFTLAFGCFEALLSSANPAGARPNPVIAMRANAARFISASFLASSSQGCFYDFIAVARC